MPLCGSAQLYSAGCVTRSSRWTGWRSLTLGSLSLLLVSHYQLYLIDILSHLKMESNQNHMTKSTIAILCCSTWNFSVCFIAASIGPGICMILASYSGCDTQTVVILFTASMGLMGAFYPGMKVNALDLSGNYAGTIMAIVNGIGAITGIIAPYLVGLLTPDVSTSLLQRNSTDRQLSSRYNGIEIKC